ncbi:MAG TPA: GDP-L-fucose synthase [Steroidobacteraceae bacterium]|nr:GDP-L-fucose synthase [Steroidobacteraceae bacterium]
MKIFVAGHRGLVGSALVRRLSRQPGVELLLRTRAELDLTDQLAVREFFAAERPAQVYLAAARVGGILANDTRPAEFIHENLVIQSNVIDAAYRHGTAKLLFLGSSCIYPKHAPQPMPEDCLLTGPLEPTNEWYAIAKIAGLKMCQAYRKQYGFDAICAMPTNLYDPGDSFDSAGSHVLPALIRKFTAAVARGADEVEIWGTGKPRREFLHVDDLADACVFLMERYSDGLPVNVGWGEDVSIAELAGLVAWAAGFKGRLRYDVSKPDGTPRKLLDVSRMSALGWQPSIDLRAGIRSTVAWYRSVGVISHS